MNSIAARYRELLTVCAWLCLLSLPAAAQPVADDASDGFLRFNNTAGEFGGELQTAVTTYRNNRGVEVDLVATVHMAEFDYYQDLNDYFSTRDAVLYELVAEENVRPDGSGVGRGGGVIGFLQTGMAKLLGLSYQLDVINYTRPNFIHADLEPHELQALMDAKGETLFSAFVALVLSELETLGNRPVDVAPQALDLSFADILTLFSRPDRDKVLKYLLGQSLASSDSSLAAMTGRGFTLLDDRNSAAIETLRDKLQDPSLKTFSLFYGAAHMPGLEQGLEEMGFDPVTRAWLTAWKTE